MICQCGAHIPRNAEYCPYCGKQQFITTRPDQLTGGRIEPFRGVFVYGDGEPSQSCLGKVARFFLWLLTIILVIVFFAWLWFEIGWSPEQIAHWLGF